MFFRFAFKGRPARFRDSQEGNTPSAPFPYQNLSHHQLTAISRQALKRFVTLFHQPDCFTYPTKRAAMVRARLDYLYAQDALLWAVREKPAGARRAEDATFL